MIVYLVLFFISCFCFHLGSKSRGKWNAWIWIGILLPTFMAGMRGIEVGTDTANYYDIYTEIINLRSTEDMISYPNTEYLFKILSIIGNSFDSFSFVLFVYQLGTILCIYDIAYKIRRYVAVWIIMWLYFTFFFNFSLNIMRQVLAIAFVIDISWLLNQGKKAKFIILSVLSIALHSSAIIACVFIYSLYSLQRRQGLHQKIYAFIYLMVLGAIYISFIKLFSTIITFIAIGRFGSYQQYIERGDGIISSTDLAYRILFFLLILIFIKMHIIPRQYILITLCLFTTEITFMFLGNYNKWLSRLSLYFLPYLLFIISYCCNSKRFAKSLKVGLNIVTCILGFFYWFYLNVYRLSNETIPYTLNL